MAIGCYTPNYLPASFRGVSFQAEEVSDENGRRAAEGEFPFANRTQVGDMGLKIERLSLRGRLQENSHLLDAQALRAACRAPGSGLLIHPTRGAMLVLCVSCRITDEVEQGQGVSNIELEFIEDMGLGANGFSLNNLLGVISLVAITAATRANVERNYAPQDARFYQAPLVVETARQSIVQIRDGYSQATALNQTQDVWRMIASFNSAINNDPVVASPKQYATLLVNGMGTLDAATLGQTKVDSFKRVVNWASKASSLDGEARHSENAVYSSTRVLAIAHVARGFLERDTTTLDAALNEFDLVSRVLQEEAQIANTECNDPVYFLAIKDFLIQVQTVLLQRAYTLPGLVTYRFKGGMHSLSAAYEIYGDARRFKDLEARNPQYAPFAFGPEVLAAEVTDG